MNSLVRVGFNITKDIPLDNVLWKPQTTITKSYLVYYILVLLLHILPAIFLDGVAKLFGARPILLKLQRKVYVSNNALWYFVLNEWKFHNEKLLAILNNLSADNQKEFGYSYKDIDLLEYFKQGIIGAKLYLLNENIDDLKTAKRHYKRMEWLDTIIKTLFFVIILWVLYRKNAFSYIMDIFYSHLLINIR